MNLLASADTGGRRHVPALAFIYDFFVNPLFIFVGGLVLLGVFFWYLGSDQDKVKRNAGTFFFIIGIASFSFPFFQQGLKYGIDIAGGVSFHAERGTEHRGRRQADSTDQRGYGTGVRHSDGPPEQHRANDVIIRPKKKDDLNLIEVQISPRILPSARKPSPS